MAAIQGKVISCSGLPADTDYWGKGDFYVQVMLEGDSPMGISPMGILTAIRLATRTTSAAASSTFFATADAAINTATYFPLSLFIPSRLVDAASNLLHSRWVGGLWPTLAATPRLWPNSVMHNMATEVVNNDNNPVFKQSSFHFPAGDEKLLEKRLRFRVMESDRGLDDEIADAVLPVKLLPLLCKGGEMKRFDLSLGIEKGSKPKGTVTVEVGVLPDAAWFKEGFLA